MMALTYGDDVVLLRRIADGDFEAFERFYQRHVSRLAQTLRIWFRLSGDLSDVLQEIFLQVWLNARAYNPARGPVSAWLLVIARSRALDLLRRKARLETSEMDLRRALEPQTGSAALDAIWVSTALARLPWRKRRTIDLAFYQGFSHSQIARKQGRPLGTIKTEIRTTLRSLRQEMQRTAAAGASQ